MRSRRVLPVYSLRKTPRRCNSGTTRSTKFLRPCGCVGVDVEAVASLALVPIFHLIGDLAARALHQHVADRGNDALIYGVTAADRTEVSENIYC
jgi:hypothetical protein